MKRIITAATAAALVVLAFSAASASAGTVVCDVNNSPCPSSEVLPAGSHVITGDTAGYPGIQFNAGGNTEFECSQNIMAAESKATIGSPLPAEFADWALTGCVHIPNAKESCTGSMNKPPTTLEATSTGGFMRIGTASEPLAFTFVCGKAPSTYTCIYKMKNTLSLDVSAEEIKALYQPMYLAEGKACNSSSANLTVRNENFGDFVSTYVPSGTVICKTGEEPCLNESNWYGAGTTLSAALAAGTKATFTTAVAKSECSTSSLSGQLTGSGGKSQNVPFEISSASLGGCSNFTTLTVEGLPWTNGLISSLEPGKLGIMRFNNVKIKYSRLGVTCTFGGQVDALIAAPSTISFQSASISFISGSGLCGGNATLSGSYSISAPSPFYLGWL